MHNLTFLGNDYFPHEAKELLELFYLQPNTTAVDT